MEMNSSCPNCGQDFEIETGFYYGSMYVSYGVTVVLVLLFVPSFYALFPGVSIPVTLLALLVFLILLSPMVFRLSRIVMLHLFGGIKRK